MDIQLWQYEQAPVELQRMAPDADSRCWFALVRSDASEQLESILAGLWRAAGYSVTSRALGVGSTLLTVSRRPAR